MSTTTKTCLQRVRVGTTWQRRRRPHVTDGSVAAGYARCAHCGADIYVGQGYQSPVTRQRAEAETARADQRRR